MAETDGKTVTPTVSEGTVPPVVVVTTEAPQVDPMETRFRELLAKERTSIVEEARRVSQSQADKTTAALQRQLQEERAKRVALEGAFNTLPTRLGPDADPSIVQNVRLAQRDAQLGVYQQQDIARQQLEREEAAKQMVLADTREDIAELGVNPDDPRLQWDLNQPDAKAFRKKVIQSARSILKEDADKSFSERFTQEMATRDAKTRKESGVDVHETPGVASMTDDKRFMAEYAAGRSDDHKRAQKILKGK